MDRYDFLILGLLNFFLEIFLAQNIAMQKMPKRKYFYWILLLELGFAVPLYYLPALTIGIFNMSYLLVAIISGIFCFFLYKENVFEAISYTGTAFAYQNITWNIMLLIGKTFTADIGKWGRFAVYLAVFVVSYTLAFFLLRLVLKKVQFKSNWMVCLSSSLIILITIFLSQMAKYPSPTLVDIIYEMTSCLFALAINYGVNILTYLVGKEKDLENEKNVLEEMLHQQAKQQKMSKETIDIINIKSHDLKKQIVALENMSKEDRITHIEEIKKAVNVYGDIAKTGNDSLDLLLTEKSLLCEGKHISFNYIVNPDGLSFIDDLDIWSLFGNAIDNAIEAQEKEEEGKRLIRLNVNVKNSFTTIHVENYCTQKISFENGLPATSKNDKDFHGYGLKSISSIVEKYNGNALVRFKNHLFTLDIMIPIPEEAPLFKNTRESVSSDSI
ncbi:MAG: GHKL domain-containing protein [Bacilli bacterium]|jgi:hypothetical protein|nr:GHKL domain-containing protein [Bacilli bacterium]MCH4211087.1 GHKL domain-containing protein [Bacilli bacterium]MCH4228630.1 GHKL domain-containing protein [Bacilli bacterium]MCI2054862.1 GHKL domain-containing protein [Bacilli bacterium]